jgi:uncharacterized membrane protein
MTAAAPIIIALFGIAAALLWGSSDYLGANAAKRNNPNAAILGVTAIGTLFYSVVFLFNQGTVDWNNLGIFYSIVAGTSLSIGLLTFYRGLDAGPVNLVSPIGSAYPLVSLLIVLLIFGGSIKLLNIIGIVIVVIGIAIASGLLNSRKSERKLSKGVLYALVTIPIWGLAYALMGKAVFELGWQKATLIIFFAGLAILPIVLTLIEGRRFWKGITRKLLCDKYVMSAGITQSLGGIIFNVGVSHTSSSAVITAISASYPVLTVFLALKGLKEKAKAVSLIGVFTTIIGIVILSL